MSPDPKSLTSIISAENSRRRAFFGFSTGLSFNGSIPKNAVIGTQAIALSAQDQGAGGSPRQARRGTARLVHAQCGG
jgi:hypothetical protein